MFVAIVEVPIIKEFFMTLFVFLFAFVFIYIILSGVKGNGALEKIFPLKSNLASILAVALAFILIFTKATRDYLILILPWIAFGIIVMVLMIVFIELAGVNVFEKSDLLSKGDRQLVALSALAFILFVVFFSLGNIMSDFFIEVSEHANDIDYLTGKHGFAKMAYAIVYNPKVYSVVILLIVAAIIVYYLTRE